MEAIYLKRRVPTGSPKMLYILKFDLLKKANIANVRLGLLILLNVVLFLISLNFPTMQVNGG